MMTRWRKYGNKKVVIDGHTFDSKAEANRYMQLRMLETAGEVMDIVVHPRYELQPSFRINGKTERAITYEADFQYLDKTGLITIEDVKGVRTPGYILKRKMLLMRIKNRLLMTVDGVPVIDPVFLEIDA